MLNFVIFVSCCIVLTAVHNIPSMLFCTSADEPCCKSHKLSGTKLKRFTSKKKEGEGGSRRGTKIIAHGSGSHKN